MRADFDARSLLHLAPVLESLQIDAPHLRLTRTAAGHYDIDDLLARLKRQLGADRDRSLQMAHVRMRAQPGADALPQPVEAARVAVARLDEAAAELGAAGHHRA